MDYIPILTMHHGASKDIRNRACGTTEVVKDRPKRFSAPRIAPDRSQACEQLIDSAAMVSCMASLSAQLVSEL